MILCPRCEKPIRNNKYICYFCGYKFRTVCKKCGYMNFYLANYCGNCGTALSFTKKITQYLKTKFPILLNYNILFKLKKFASGFAFGILLVIFALGSMGMTNNHKPFNKEFLQNFYTFYSSSDVILTNFQDPIIATCYKKIIAWKESIPDINSYATIKDLYSITQILQKYLDIKINVEDLLNFNVLCNDINDILPTKPHNSNSLIEYKINKQSTQYITRIKLVHYLYKLAFNTIVKNNQHTLSDVEPISSYIDIPSYHPYAYQIKFLENLGIKFQVFQQSSQSSEKFNPYGKVQLSEITHSIIKYLLALDKTSKRTFIKIYSHKF